MTPTMEETLARGALAAAQAMLGAMLDEIARASGDRRAVRARVRERAEAAVMASAQTFGSEFSRPEDRHDMRSEFREAGLTFVSRAFDAAQAEEWC